MRLPTPRLRPAHARPARDLPRAALSLAAAVAACSPSPRATASAPASSGTAGVPTVTRAVFGAAPTPVAAIAISADTLIGAAETPLSLTASDGSGLELVKLEARAVVEGPIAFTELRLRFTNPADRVREGRFAITLPPGAAVSRFAMASDGNWLEAEMVERQAARRAYEDFLHRRQDPALLEKQAGNEFSARVFPIPARGSKDLIISYSQALPAGTAYTLPLRGLPAIANVDVSARIARVTAGGLRWEDARMQKASWKPDRDFRADGTGGPAAIRSGDLVAMHVMPTMPGAIADAPRDLTLLVDTSASRALGFERQLESIAALVAGLRTAQPDLRLAVAAFDQDVQAIYDGPASGFGAGAITALRAREALGASDLGAALAWCKQRGSRGRLAIITDAVVTAGASETADLQAAVRALAPAVERVDVIVSGGLRDEEVAKDLVHGSLARDGAVLDLDRGAREVARRLALATRSGLAVHVDGARWVWPERVDGVQPGDDVIVYAAMDPARRGRDLVASIGGPAQTLAPADVTPALLERATAGAQIERLEAERGRSDDPKRRRALADQIIDLSLRERVLSDFTALLVLETDADYARLGINRAALADVLVVGPNGVEALHRLAPRTPTIAVDPVKTALAKPKADGAEKKEARMEAAKRPATDEPAAVADDKSRDLDGVADVADMAAVADVAGAEGAGQGEAITVGSVAGAAVAQPMAATAPLAGDSLSAERERSAPAGAPSAPPAPPPAPEPARRARPMRVTAGSGRAANVASEDDFTAMVAQSADERRPSGPPPLTGPLAEIMTAIKAGHRQDALVRAERWRQEQPGDVLALIGLGEAFEASAQPARAARAYGSIIDLFPARADLRRFAGERLERLGVVARPLAIDTYRRAVADRPDHLTGHRLLAYALVRAGRLGEAFAALEAGIKRQYPDGRFAGAERVLHEDLGLIGAAWAAREPAQRPAIERRLAAAGSRLATGPSTRFVLYWETDANDVDFHIHDRRGGHAYYSSKVLPSGGELYADITTGYGPECFTIPGVPTAGPYQLQIHYYSRGPMGYGMGLLEILRHDGKGGLRFEHRPYVIMQDQAFVDLGSVEGAAPAKSIAR